MNNQNETPTPLTDAVHLAIAAGDWCKESDCTEAALNHARDLERQLAAAKAQIELHCRDWAEDHTALQELVRKHVPGADVEGDSYGVPGIVQLAEMLVDQLIAKEREVERLTHLLGNVSAECARWKEQADTAEARWRDEVVEAREARDKAERECEQLKSQLPLVNNRTRNHARELLGKVQRHDDGNGASHGCVEVTSVASAVETLIAECEELRADKETLMETVANLEAACRAIGTPYPHETWEQAAMRLEDALVQERIITTNLRQQIQALVEQRAEILAPKIQLETPDDWTDGTNGKD